MLLLIKRHLAVVLLFAVVSVVMTLPVALRLTTHVAGSGGDPWQTLWRFTLTQTQVQEAVSTGEVWPLVATQLLGQGEPRLVNLAVWPWLPLQFLLGQPTTYNIVWLLSFILAGWGMYALARYSIGRLPHAPPSLVVEGAAIISGVLYMLLPYHVAHALGHFGAAQIQWLPILILQLFRLRDTGRLRHLMALSLLFILQVWTEHHYALWFVLFGVLWVIWQARTWRATLNFRTPRFWTGVVIAGVAISIVIASYWPTVRLAAAYFPDELLRAGVARDVCAAAAPRCQ